ncbi:MAG: hypothetical protein AB1758_29110 [Candidatus Eremiobacterota bacterium]
MTLTRACLITLLLAIPSGWVAAADSGSFAIYAEYARDSNKLMKNGLNRRVFNVVEAQEGSDIALRPDGAITLQPGRYRLTGFSLVTMQATFAPPSLRNNTNYPGYCLVYPTSVESTGMKKTLANCIGIGSPQTAYGGTPSTFDAIFTAGAQTDIAVGHQSGEKLNDEVYLSVYEVDGTPSEYHVFARIAITRIR